MQILRDYQEKLIEQAREALRKYKRIIIQSPTGSGKTFVIAGIIRMAATKKSRSLIVSHRIEIVKQNATACTGIPVTIISPKLKNLPDTLVSSGMAQTLYRRIDYPDWKKYLENIDLLIIDEAHDSSANFLFKYINKNCFVIGFTATPVRYGTQRQLGLDYNYIVNGPTIQYLIDQGYLCRCRLFSLDAPKMDDVDFDPKRGDYSLAQMSKKFRTKTRYIGTVTNWENIAKGTKTIVFCCSSEQAISLTKEFCNRGYNAKYSLSGDFDDDNQYSDERDHIIEDFKNNKFNILINVGQMISGINVPDIKTCVICYATMSLTKYLQCLGRTARPHQSKNGEFLCLDMGANYERLGTYAQERTWYLWHQTTRGGGPAPIKECPQQRGGCGRLIPIQSINCPFCGYHFPTHKESYEIKLQEIIDTQNTVKETIEQYVARKKLHGWKNNWILRDICQKNPDHQKEVFMRAISILQTNHGEYIKPQYWYFFKKEILKSKGR